ncbi:MAG: orotidine-5'-phosphate decarboxylase [Alphaproteobacteria bacterium]|nr:orotidine-5'-phosphate decarboxylase [Alphaproteobacteria bacterium]
MASPVFVAIDATDLAEARTSVSRLAGAVGGIKLGLEFFVANGPAGIRAAMAEAAGLPLFLDLKLHDIPNTVAGAVRAAALLKPRYVTIHAAGGPAMLSTAADAAKQAGGAGRPKLLGVTVLTSLSGADLNQVGFADRPMGDQVMRLAALAKEGGLDGVVCSPHEVAALRRALGPDFVLMVPGVRPSWAGADDQKRVMTPAEAMRAGATHLVIGRPILRAADPAEAARRIAQEIAGAPAAA